MSGFTVELAPDVLADPALARRASSLIASGLAAGRRLLGDARTDQITSVRILVVATSAVVAGPAAYHPVNSDAVEPARFNTIEVNLTQFITAAERIQPYAMTHELVHAFEALVLGTQSRDIVAMYQRALASGRYAAVPKLFMSVPERAYALNSHHEFLAEASEAYLATNDYYPFVATQLATHDPETYAELERLWGPPPVGEHAALQPCGVASATTLTGAASSIRFVNLGARPAVVGWLDDRGAYIVMETIAPNASAPLTTWGGHWFELRDAETHACIAQVQALDRPADAVSL